MCNPSPALPGMVEDHTRGRCAPGDLLHLRMRLAAQRQVQVSKSSVATLRRVGLPRCSGQAVGHFALHKSFLVETIGQ